MIWVCPKLGDSGGQFNGEIRSKTIRLCNTVAAKNNAKKTFNLPLTCQLVFAFAASVWWLLSHTFGQSQMWLFVAYICLLRVYIYI